jgi:5-methyltetrahydrofolate--homocysteine methyltransferase
MANGVDQVYLERLKDAVVRCDLDNIESLAKSALSAGVDPLKAIQMGLAGGIREVGERYGRGEAYLPELVMAAKVMQTGVAILEPHLKKGTNIGGIGTVVLGTVEGDIHDIGKSLVGTLLGTQGFSVVDLGVDVSATRFVETVEKTKPKMLGMSALMTTTMISMPEVLSMLASKGLRKNLIVMVGGAPTTREWGKEIGADAQAGDAVEALSLAKELIKGR